MKVNISKKKTLLTSMLRIRAIEETIAKKYSEEKMRCPIHLSAGQEAVAVGICSNLNKKDSIVTAHRSHAHYLAKGGSLNKMIAEHFFCKICGIYTHHNRRSDPNGAAANIGCIDAIDPFAEYALLTKEEKEGMEKDLSTLLIQMEQIFLTYWKIFKVQEEMHN